jgi:hypothetical protein
MWFGDHPQEGLAKFGYRLKREVDFFFAFPLCCGDKMIDHNVPNMTTSQLFPSKSGEFEQIFLKK